MDLWRERVGWFAFGGAVVAVVAALIEWAS